MKGKEKNDEKKEVQLKLIKRKLLIYFINQYK